MFCVSCLVVSDSVAFQVLLSMGFSGQEYWSGLPFPSPRDLPNPQIEPRSPALQADSLPAEPPVQFSSVAQLCPTLCDPMNHSRFMGSLSINNSWSPPKPMSIESVMPSNHLILCHPVLLLPSIFPSIRVFSNESALRIRWPKYWSFSFNISPSNEHQDWCPLGWARWISLQSKGLSRVFSNTTVQKHQFFSTQLSF